MRTFARMLPKSSLVGILCCVRDLTFCERQMFLFESVREIVCKNAAEPNKSDRRSCEHKYFTFRFVGMLHLLLLSVTS